MVSNKPQEYRAKIINMGDSVRGWIPTGVVRALKGRGGDYIVFHMDAEGAVTATMQRQTSAKKALATKRKTRKK